MCPVMRDCVDLSTENAVLHLSTVTPSHSEQPKHPPGPARRPTILTPAGPPRGQHTRVRQTFPYDVTLCWEAGGTSMEGPQHACRPHTAPGQWLSTWKMLFTFKSIATWPSAVWLSWLAR